MQRQISKLLTTAAVALGALAFTAPAMANQCIWNKSLTQLEVWWFRITDLTLSTAPGGASVVSTAKPDQKAQLPPGSGGCTNSDEMMTAMIAVYSGAFGKHGQIMVKDAFVRINGRPDVVNTNTVTPGVVARHGDDLYQTNTRRYLITTPSTSNYLDISGWVFGVSHGPGGPVPAR